MRKIDCCICLEDNVCHYTQEEMKTKCEHPVCKNCYFQLPQCPECPLCRMSIYSLLLDIKKAIFRVINVRYEKLFSGSDNIIPYVIIRRVGNNYFHHIQYIDGSLNYQEINAFEYDYDRVFINDDGYTDESYTDDEIEYDNSYFYSFSNKKREMDQYYYLHEKHIENKINIEQKVCDLICV